MGNGSWFFKWASLRFGKTCTLTSLPITISASHGCFVTQPITTMSKDDPRLPAKHQSDPAFCLTYESTTNNKEPPPHGRINRTLADPYLARAQPLWNLSCHPDHVYSQTLWNPRRFWKEQFSFLRKRQKQFWNAINIYNLTRLLTRLTHFWPGVFIYEDIDN